MFFEKALDKLKGRVALAQGGKVIGRPGGLVEPGVVYYAKSVRGTKYDGLIENMVQEYNNKVLEAYKNKDLSVFKLKKGSTAKNGISEFMRFLSEHKKYKKDYQYLKERFGRRSNIDLKNVINIDEYRNKLADELIAEANKSNKFVRSQEIELKVLPAQDKKYMANKEGKKGLRKSASKLSKQIVSKTRNNLFSLEKKFNMVFDKIVKGEIPLEQQATYGSQRGPLTQTITNQLQVGANPDAKMGWKQYFNKHPKVKKIIKKEPKVLEYAFFNPNSKNLPGETFDEIIEAARIKVGGAAKFSTPIKNATKKDLAMEFAIRHWDQNNFNETGQSKIKFFNKNGNEIKWKRGMRLPRKGISFTYGNDPTKWTYKNLDSIDAFKSGHFNELYDRYDAYRNILNKNVTDPITKKKITFEELLRKSYKKAYGYDKGILNIEHTKGVLKDPFKNLIVMDARMNNALGAINQHIPNRNLRNFLAKELMGSLYGKTGSAYQRSLEKKLFTDASNILTQKNTPTKSLYFDAINKAKNSPFYKNASPAIKKIIDQKLSSRGARAALGSALNSTFNSGLNLNKISEVFPEVTNFIKAFGGDTGQLIRKFGATKIGKVLGVLGLPAEMLFLALDAQPAIRGDIEGFKRNLDETYGFIPGVSKAIGAKPFRQQLVEATDDPRALTFLSQFEQQKKYNDLRNESIRLIEEIDQATQGGRLPPSGINLQKIERLRVIDNELRNITYKAGEQFDPDQGGIDAAKEGLKRMNIEQEAAQKQTILKGPRGGANPYYTNPLLDLPGQYQPNVYQQAVRQFGQDFVQDISSELAEEKKKQERGLDYYRDPKNLPEIQKTILDRTYPARYGTFKEGGLAALDEYKDYDKS